jgi:hypothetical protein
MSGGPVAPILQCELCRRVWVPADKDRWRAYPTDGEANCSSSVPCARRASSTADRSASAFCSLVPVCDGEFVQRTPGDHEVRGGLRVAGYPRAEAADRAGDETVEVSSVLERGQHQADRGCGGDDFSDVDHPSQALNRCTAAFTVAARAPERRGRD